MAKSICVIDGCDRKMNAKGLCSRHYNRWSRYGDPLAGAPTRDRKVPGQLCAAQGCGRDVALKGVCNAHYLRLNRHGSLGELPLRAPTTTEERFWAAIRKEPAEVGGCWVWVPPKMATGYGRVTNDSGERELAHRYSFTLHGGRIPLGTEIDHLCRNRACVNPDHLEAVPHKVNVLRGMAPGAVAIRNGACGKGHPRTAENMRIRKDGKKICVICRRVQLREWRRKRKEGGRK